MHAMLKALLAIVSLCTNVQSSSATANNPQVPNDKVDGAACASSMGDIVTRSDMSEAANLQSMGDLTLLTADDKLTWSLWCPNDNWVYYYNWGPLVNYICDQYGDSLEHGFNALIPESHYLVDRAKSVTLRWSPVKGGTCQGTCKQVFNTMRSSGGCKAEEFWMKEMINLTYDGCGVASWKYQYQSVTPLKHGSGLCWLEKDEVKTYEPKDNVFERFCYEAVYEIRKKGSMRFMDATERIGYYWTDYNRKVAYPTNTSKYFDIGMVHIWIKAPQNITPCPTQGRYGDHMIEDEKNGLTEELCMKHLTTLQNMDCAQPLGTSQGGRYWADCFEWGIEASGYNARKISS
ncbi:hypothetical protein ColTof4_05345 [Colletotrichum tofieldiae]|uniref:Uncharacterized protein n=1 Tax=Colletotrichum tofieldiae TaxID=708197 RepID=A0A166UVD7_9PEZI|nr:hypothetical protein CT0861_06083 [Colletotrichum tofieldiae]GKT63062.1 hypothetical protein ColTof3_10401 [Colletotrichum tofieldiae]GKT72922.1 hypothetical protein ColTof4_05345 [Colletotrichum tofieldiae]